MDSKSHNELWLIIPTGDRVQYLNPIFQDSGISAEKRVLVRTKEGPEINGARNIFVKGDINIQRWWNTGIDFVKGQNGRYVAILNDDVIVKYGQLQEMLQELKDEGVALVASRNSNGGFWGHAFILDLNTGIRPDERFFWWFGDFDLKEQAKRKGGFLQSSIEIFHMNPNKETHSNPILEILANSDRKTFYKKYRLKWLASKFPNLARSVKALAKIMDR